MACLVGWLVGSGNLRKKLKSLRCVMTKKVLIMGRKREKWGERKKERGKSLSDRDLYVYLFFLRTKEIGKATSGYAERR